ncbi:MAG: restriction endonuclease subunit S [Dehalococcoidales bacterium]|nr:restriction endonuclease subunit S [Dehalococcoidales bacterium]
MNSNWNLKKFGVCATLVRDSCIPSEIDSVPYIGLEHIEEGTLRLLGVGDSRDVVSTKARFKAGDILFGKLRPYFRKVIQPKFSGICSTDIWVVRAKEGTEQGFLYYWMASNDFVDTATRASEGTKMPRAKWDFLEGVEKPCPSLPEQRAIASILRSLDDKIELNRQMNKTLESMAQAIFKSWFIDFEPFLDQGMQDSQIGPIPIGWESKPLDTIADFLNGLALQKYPPEGDDFLPVIKIVELRRGVTDSSGKASPFIDKAYVVQDGDILFSWSGSLEVCIWCGGEGALNQHLFKVTSAKYPKWFYYHWIKYHLPEFQAIAAGKATTMGHIQRYHLSNAYVTVPLRDQLERADKIMSPIIEQIIQNNLQARTLANIRDTLLPKLLSGEIRIENINSTS